MKRAGALSIIAVVLLCVGLTACGTNSSSSSSVATSGGETETVAPAKDSTSEDQSPGRAEQRREGSEPGMASEGPAGQAAQEPGFTPRPHHDSGGGAGQFKVKGGDNSIQEFGDEGSEAQLSEAATALHGYLDARAERAWSAACSYLDAAVTKQLSAHLQQSQEGAAPSCAALLAGLYGGLPEAALREAAVADAGALRSEGDRSFLLFHGARGTVYFMPMAREGGDWKVEAIAPSEVP